MGSEKDLLFQVRVHIQAKLSVLFQVNCGNVDSLRNVRTPSASLTPTIHNGPPESGSFTFRHMVWFSLPLTAEAAPKLFPSSFPALLFLPSL